MATKFIRARVLRGELLAGAWCNLGSSVTAEIVGRAGFDWALLDLEHGPGDEAGLLHQLQALGGTPAAPIVRVAWNEAPRFKRALDLGPSGIMVPYVCSAAEATAAVAAMRYPPRGVRGVAKVMRASDYGYGFDDYFARADEGLLTVLQVETAAAVERAEEIAAVDGADVLFIGPLDLSAGLGLLQQFDHPRFREARARVVAACRKAGKAAGILLPGPAQIARAVEDGFTFIAAGSDAGMVATGMRTLADAFDPHRRKS